MLSSKGNADCKMIIGNSIKKIENEYSRCRLCPRNCSVNRGIAKGYCHEGARLRVARASVHMWEEPCISGEKGSGTVFFSGCNMRCIFCQNRHISIGTVGQEISVERLAEIFFELADKGVNNINLVTGDHFIPSIRLAIENARMQGFSLPFLLNTSSYVRVDALKMLDGLIDIYLPDFKFYKRETAKKYSNAPDYPEVARLAIAEMVRQLKTRYNETCYIDDEGIMKHGIIVRHLLMPGGLLEAKLIVKELHESYGDDIYLSLMNQYTPIMENVKDEPILQKKPTAFEYDKLINYSLDIGVKRGFMQEGETASESFIPEFDEKTKKAVAGVNADE